jgi:hypothetical protein
MALIDLIKKPAKTAADIKAKIEAVRAEDPAARKPALLADRKQALLEGRDKDADRISDQLRAIDNDAERKQHGLELLTRELAAAEQAEHQAEVKRLRKLAETSKKRTPTTLAKYEQGVKLIEEALAELDEIEPPIAEYNAIAPQGEKLDTAEFTYRGGIKAEPRTERSRRTVAKFWVFDETGHEVSEKLVGQIKQTGENRGELEIVDFRAASTNLHEIAERDRDFDGAYLPRRIVRVTKRRRVEIFLDEYRAGYTPTPLAHEVGILPTVLPISDPRPARQTISQFVIEDIEPAKAEASAA